MSSKSFSSVLASVSIASVNAVFNLHIASASMPFHQQNSQGVHSTLISQKPSKAPISATKEGFDFELTDCSPVSTDRIKCSFLVLNTREKRTLSFRPQYSRIIDDRGNETIGRVGRIGGRNFDGGAVVYGVDIELPTNVPINGELTFNVKPFPQNGIKYLELDFGYNFKVEFTF